MIDMDEDSLKVFHFMKCCRSTKIKFKQLDFYLNEPLKLPQELISLLSILEVFLVLPLNLELNTNQIDKIFFM